jgi:hypothetical protein
LVKIQSLAKGFLGRLSYYEDLKVRGVKLENQTLKRNLIAYKLGRISKKQIEGMNKERAGADIYMKHMSSKTKSAEALIEEFLPNVERIFRERSEQLSNLKIKIEQRSDKKLDFRWQKIFEKASNRKEHE